MEAIVPVDESGESIVVVCAVGSVDYDVRPVCIPRSASGKNEKRDSGSNSGTEF